MRLGENTTSLGEDTRGEDKEGKENVFIKTNQ
jgi:hypothetical protein